MRFSLKPAWIAIALLAILVMAATVQACTPAPLPESKAAGAITSGLAGPLYLHDYSKNTCTREAMQQCEYACMMPGGILDLNCYEDCIYSIC